MEAVRACCFFLFLVSCHAGITVTNVELQQGQILTWRYAIVSLQDALFGSSEPHLQFKFDIASSMKEGIPPNPEMLLFHHQVLGKQVGAHGRWCCTPKLYNEHLCTEKDKIYFADRASIGFKRINQSDEFLTANNSLLFYWENFSAYTYDPLANSISVSDSMFIDTSGVWYLVLAHCNGSYDVTVSGVFEWRNPFGFLSGTIFAYLPLYATLTICFACLLGIWSVNLFRHRKNLMGLQHTATVAMVAALLENLLWTIDYVQYNQGGKISDAINVIGALLTASKMTIIRTLILLVALGYSITTPILEQKTKLLVVILTATYGIGSAISEYLWVWKTMGVDIPVYVEAIFLGFTSLLNVIYLVWIGLSLFNHFKNLKQLNQTAKLSMYYKFSVFLGIFVLLSGLFFLLQFAFILTDVVDSLWQIWWLWDGYWEIGYFLVVVLIAYLWWPNENNERYAYSVQIGADGVPLDNMNDVGLGTDSSDEGELKISTHSAKHVPEDDVDLANDSTDGSDDDHSWGK